MSVTCLFAGSPVTRYYKQTKIVTADHKERAGDGSGQFITFVDNGCYDSDKKGYTVNNGFLKFGKSTADRVYYSGSSYWGQATYLFTEKYGRLNIRIEDSGITYVYVLATPPVNVSTCALIKEKKPDTVNPVNPISGSVDVVFPPLPERNKPPERKIVRKQCSLCKGKGECFKGDSFDYTGNATKSWCSICESYRYPHYHSSCPSCSGKGYTEKHQY